ncbi:MAG: glycosyltransferase family 4 protein [Cyanobacteria bacterium J06649_4]
MKTDKSHRGMTHKNTEDNKLEDANFRIMLFDLSIYGHHPGYIQYLLEYVKRHQLTQRLLIVVSPRFITAHADVVAFAETLETDNITFIPISVDEEKGLKPRSSGINRNFRNFQEWAIFRRYAKQHRADHALVMYYDTYQYPLALRFNPTCSVSGIYFRPSFHYGQFSHGESIGLSYRRQKWEKFLLDRVLANRRLKNLFSLDPFIVERLEKEHSHGAKLCHLPDPVKLQKSSQSEIAQLRQSLEIAPNKKIFLLFGALTERKGVFKVLDALALLPQQVSKQVTLILAGEASEENQRLIDKKVQFLPKAKQIQVIVRYEFLPEKKIPTYFGLADFVLAPYQRHIGMSGMTMLAAAAHTPLLSSNYGLMGELVQRFKLGITVDSTLPTSIAEGVEQLINNPADIDVARMDQFSQMNAAEKFSATIFNRIMPTHRKRMPAEQRDR